MTTEPANPRISGRARFLLLVMTFVVPVMAAALDPGAAAATSFTTLFAFPGGSNGADPFAAVTQGPDGALYGTTQLGGGGLCAGTCGTIFKLTPPHRTSARWSWTLLNSFGGSNFGAGGGFPEGGPALGTDGSLYVVQTVAGLSSCGFCGDVYKLTLTGHPGEPWTITNIYPFGTGIDAAYPWNPLIEGADGAFYGLSQQGGDPNCFSGGCGALFKLRPPASPGGSWKASVVYRETSAGFLPNPGLTQFQGAFYYTSSGHAGDLSGCGSVSRIAPKPGGGWRNEVLFAFRCPPPATFFPMYGVLVERGMIFGTIDGTSGGWVFALTPPPRPGARWDMKILHEFPKSGNTDGSSPTGAVVAGAHGMIFGATSLGGSQNCGTVWQLTPPAAAGGRWTEQILHDFQNGADGCFPASISPGKGGVLYGTTQGKKGGEVPNGTVFEIVP
jgi:uncharacterized repeat protein (TIGR03803 family)